MQRRHNLEDCVQMSRRTHRAPAAVDGWCVWTSGGGRCPLHARAWRLWRRGILKWRQHNSMGWKRGHINIRISSNYVWQSCTTSPNITFRAKEVPSTQVLYNEYFSIWNRFHSMYLPSKKHHMFKKIVKDTRSRFHIKMHWMCHNKRGHVTHDCNDAIPCLN